MFGIDVYQGDGAVDWAAVKNSGKTFAYVKATEGVSIKDEAFAGHWFNMKKYGIIRGAYHFFHPRTSDPVQQAREFIKTVGKFEAGDLPPALDVEVDDGANRSTIIAKMKLWLSEVEKALLEQTGRKIKPIIYTYPNFWIETLGNPFDFNAYPLWIAEYGVIEPIIPSTWGSGNYLIHQYEGDVSNIAGVSRKADLNRFNPVQFGSSGNRVKEVQNLLTDLKKPEMAPGNVNGYFDIKTKTAVVNFQKANNLQADGIVGIKTWTTLLWANLI